jgi:hypothetical protein
MWPKGLKLKILPTKFIILFLMIPFWFPFSLS